MKWSVVSSVVWVAVVGGALSVAVMSRCPARAADLTITNQVIYHHREVFVSLEGVPLEEAIYAIYQRALAPRSVTFLREGQSRLGDLITIRFQGSPRALQSVLADLLNQRGYSLHTTQWGSDIIVARDIGDLLPAPPRPSVPPIGEGLGGAGE